MFLLGAFLAGLVYVSFSCVLPLVPGYISMLSGIGMEQLRKGEVPSSGLFASALASLPAFPLSYIFRRVRQRRSVLLRQNRALSPCRRRP